MPKFSAKDYNFISKRIRENYPLTQEYGYNRGEYLAVGDILAKLALDLAKHYAKDNPNFKPLRFLDACSPDPDRLPLSELWEDYIAKTSS